MATNAFQEIVILDVYSRPIELEDLSQLVPSFQESRTREVAGSRGGGPLFAVHHSRS